MIFDRALAQIRQLDQNSPAIAFVESSNDESRCSSFVSILVNEGEEIATQPRFRRPTAVRPSIGRGPVAGTSVIPPSCHKARRRGSDQDHQISDGPHRLARVARLIAIQSGRRRRYLCHLVNYYLSSRWHALWL